MKLSSFGEKYTGQSGIVDLMADLGEALHTNPNMISMGGGNPSRIPTVEEIYRDLLVNLLSAPNGTYNILGKYQPPQGDEQLLKQLAQLLRAEYGWPITDRNVAISNGGQSAFFVLSNLLAGKYTDGSIKQIRFPLVPEYLGYTDAGLETNFFSSTRPAIDIIDEHVYKYRVDFESLEVTDRTAALCVSRPTNPTGNVLTDNEVSQLDAIARESHVPLIIDGAYGAPFPNIIFERVTPHWNDNTILLLSLSKLGLPGVRTGFIVASEEMIHAYANANTILNLACGNVGPAIAGKLFEDREVLRIGSELIMPYYRDKAMRAMELVIEACSDLPMYVHKPEGAIFLWLWFKDLPVHSTQLYQLL
ncbi:MAG: valine--pyruvate transaminase, partial [Pseudohongiellaceae bacterium]